MRDITIADVARQARTSKSTVSQYLNGRFEYMSARTRHKIDSVIEDLGFVPNPIARNLKRENTHTIGVVVRSVAGFFTGRILRGIDDYCKENGYGVLIQNSDSDPEVEQEALSYLKMHKVDGILIASSGENSARLNSENQNGTPVVHMHLDFEDLATGAVISDYYNGAHLGTGHLLELGHRRIGFITRDFSRTRSREDRYRGFIDALEEKGLEFDPDLLVYWDSGSGFQPSLKNMLDNPHPPTALFSMHMVTTVGLLEELKALRVHIPGDLSILGFDELPLAELLSTPVSVIRQDPYRIGRSSARMLVESIEKGKKALTQRMILPCEFVPRASCLPLNEVKLM